MATVEDRINNWALEELRWDTQINMDVAVAWYKKWLQIFQKAMLEYVSWMQNTSNVLADLVKDQANYSLPLGESWKPDFYSIIQLRVAYHTDKFWNPIYRVCKPINIWDYNIRPTNNTYEDGKLKQQWGRQVGSPVIWGKISEINPRYTFVDKDTIKIYPTPTENVDNWIFLNYNYIENVESITASTNESNLNLPRYFFDAIEDYMTFRLYQAENPELAQHYYQQFDATLHDNIYGLNKDKRPVEESFANTSYFSHY